MTNRHGARASAQQSHINTAEQLLAQSMRRRGLLGEEIVLARHDSLDNRINRIAKENMRCNRDVRAVDRTGCLVQLSLSILDKQLLDFVKVEDTPRQTGDLNQCYT